MITLKNDILSIKVDRHGAELWSIRDHSGREFIWQADPAFWKRHAPVLFPIVGSLLDKKYRVDGKEYSLEQHGFARDMDFHLVSSDENTLWYELKSDAETLAKYPYAFTLKIGYKLTGNKIQVMWEVSNNDGKTMYFQIGAHPAFYYPDFNPDTEERGAFRLYKRGENGEMKPLETLKYILISHFLYNLKYLIPCSYQYTVDKISVVIFYRCIFGIISFIRNCLSDFCVCYLINLH